MLEMNNIVFSLKLIYLSNPQVNKIDFFELDLGGKHKYVPSSCNYGIRVPLMGNARISLQPKTIESESNQSIDGYSLNIETKNAEDLWFLSTKLFFFLKEVEDLSLHPLRKVVAGHYNSLPPHPGFLAEPGKTCDNLHTIIGRTKLKEVEDKGFTVIDSKVMTTASTANCLLSLLKEKTGQDKSIRSDTVAFLNQEDSNKCRLQEHYQLLMGVTSYLNECLNFERSDFEPMYPGTERRPLTNPNEIQAAVYRENEFYTEHRWDTVCLHFHTMFND